MAERRSLPAIQAASISAHDMDYAAKTKISPQSKFGGGRKTLQAMTPNTNAVIPVEAFENWRSQFATSNSSVRGGFAAANEWRSVWRRAGLGIWASSRAPECALREQNAGSDRMLIMQKRKIEAQTPLITDAVDGLIYVIRGRRVMLDRDLARIYGVSTSRLNEQVKRNKLRFPDDFAFKLTADERKNWVSQFAIPNSSLKMGLRIPPYAFTEHGAVMLASVLNSSVAVAASIQIVRAFNRLRRSATAHKDLAEARRPLKLGGAETAAR